jgi:nitrous oxidase accessory protein NosD
MRVMESTGKYLRRASDPTATWNVARGNQPLNSMFALMPEPGWVDLAGDRWTIHRGIDFDRTIHIRGFGRASTLEFISTIAGAAITVSASNVVIDGIRLIGNTATQYGIKVTGSNVTIRNCEFEGFRSPIYVLNADGVVIKNCRITGQISTGIEYYGSDDGIVGENVIANAVNGTIYEIKIGNSSLRNSVVGNTTANGQIYIDNTSSAGNANAANTGTVTVAT